MAPTQKLEDISLTLFIDDEKNKVLYAETGLDFINILLGFFMLPLGTVSRLVSKDSSVQQPSIFNCISSLRQSVENLDPKYFSEDWNIRKVLNPINSGYGSLVYDFDDAELSKFLHGFIDHYFWPSFFIVCDDLRVMPSNVDTTMWILQNFGIDYVPKTLTVNVTETMVVDLLKFMLGSKTPLTDLFLRKKLPVRQNLQTQPLFKLVAKLPDHEVTLKVVISKSRNKILFAEAEARITNLLLSFLTIPLGLVPLLGFYGLGSFDNFFWRGLKSSPVSIDKRMLIGLLEKDNSSHPLIGSKDILMYCRMTGANMMVADDLSLQPFSSANAMALLRESKVEEKDLEVRDIMIDLKKVLIILKAAMSSSSSALTEGLRPFL